MARTDLRVLQLISPDTVPGAMGFSPRPNPKLIATYPMKGEAICVSRGLDRDRVVDETGGQTVVFGRRGARPFHLSEMLPFLRHVDGIYPRDENAVHTGPLYRVENVARRGDELFTSSGHELEPTAPPTAPVPASQSP